MECIVHFTDFYFIGVSASNGLFSRWQQNSCIIYRMVTGLNLRCFLSGITIFLVIVVRKRKELLSPLGIGWSIFLTLKKFYPRAILPYTALPFFDVSPHIHFWTTKGKKKIRYALNIWRLTLFSVIWTCMWVVFFLMPWSFSTSWSWFSSVSFLYICELPVLLGKDTRKISSCLWFHIFPFLRLAATLGYTTQSIPLFNP